MEFLIGVDCGGTSTKGTAYDLEGNIVKQVQSGQGNVLVDFEEALGHIKEVIQTLLTETSGKCRHILCGVAGIDGKGMKEKLTRALNVNGVELTLINDGELGYLKHIGKKDGVFLIAGTGSLVIIRSKGEFKRIGGWGHLLGDEGGAYWLGKQVVKNYLDEEDRGLDYSLLSHKVKETLEVNSPREAVEQFMTLTKKEVASLAILAFESEKLGDLQAKKIQDAAAEQLVEQLNNATRFFDNMANVNLALAGSVIEKNDCIRSNIIKNLAPCYQLLESSDQYDNTAAVLNYYRDKK